MKNVKLTIIGGLVAGALLIVPGVAARADDHGHRHIPPGHLPPPGMCRIWYPDRPPGHQPPPGDCRVLSRQVPRGAWLVGREVVWDYDEVHHHFYTRGVYNGRPFTRDMEIRRDIRDVRDARQDLQRNQQQLQKNSDELNKDRAELRRDIRDGASRKEIRQDRQEIHEDVKKIAESKRDVRQSQNKLEAARDELRDDLRRR